MTTNKGGNMSEQVTTSTPAGGIWQCAICKERFETLRAIDAHMVVTDNGEDRCPTELAPTPDYYTVVWAGGLTGNDIQSRLLFTTREEAETFAADDSERDTLTNGRVVPLAIIPF